MGHGARVAVRLPGLQAHGRAAAPARLETWPRAAQFQEARTREAARAAEYLVTLAYGDRNVLKILELEAADVHLPALELADADAVVGNLRVLRAESPQRHRLEAARSAIVPDAHPGKGAKHFRQFLCPAALYGTAAFKPQRRCRQGHRVSFRNHFGSGQGVRNLD